MPAEPWRRNQYAVLASVFVSFMGFSFVIPFLPLYIRQLGVEDLGQVALLSGLAFGVAPLFSGLLAPFWGSLADRYGVKIMVQRALFSFALLNALMALVGSPWQLLVLRAGIGLFGGFGPMTASLVTIGAPKREIGPAIGKLQATQIFATALGPTIGGVVADAFGIRVSFLVTASLCFASFGLITLLYREERADAISRRRAARLPIGALFRIGGFVPLVAILLLAQFADRGFGPLLPLFVAELDPTLPVASTSGLILTAGSLVSAAAASQVGRVMSRREARYLLPLSLLIGFIATLPLAFVTQVWQLVALRVLFGVASGTTATLTYAAATQVVPEESRSTAFGFLGSATSLATATGPLTSGALASASLRLAFVVSALVYAVVLAIGASVARRAPPPPTVGGA